MSALVSQISCKDQHFFSTKSPAVVFDYSLEMYHTSDICRALPHVFFFCCSELKILDGIIYYHLKKYAVKKRAHLFECRMDVLVWLI